MKRVLMVVTNVERLEPTGAPTGVWLSGLTHPYFQLMEAGYEIDIASPRGGAVTVDPFSHPAFDRGIGRDDLISAGFLAATHHAHKLDCTLALDAVDADLYRAVVLCGGNGAMFDLPECAPLQALLRAAFESGRVIGAISHGVAGLLDVALSTGRSLLRGQIATGLSTEERGIAERLIGASYYPFDFETALRDRAGARYVKLAPYSPHVVVAGGGRLVTAQNHVSSAAFARKLVAVLASAGAPPPRGVRAAPEFEPTTGVLAAVNQFFHDDYEELVRRERLRFERQGNPVIVVTGGELILRKDGRREVVTFIPPLFQKLKAVGHMLFGTYLSLLMRAESGPSAADLVRLEQQHLLVDAALHGLEAEGFPSEALASQRVLLEPTAALLASVRSARAIDLAAVRAFAREAGRRMRENNQRAQRLELDALHQQVCAWLAAMTPGERARLFVVVCGSHQARYQEIASVYFRRLLGEAPGEGAHREDRLLYAESTFDEADALDLIARHAIDQDAGEAFFGDRFLLQRDLLSGGADAYVDALLARDRLEVETD